MRLSMHSVAREPIGFRKHTLAFLSGLALLGALAIGVSLHTHPNFTNRVDVFNQRRPMTVLVAIQGTTSVPSFISFLAIVKPGSRVISVVPISGRTKVTAAGIREPLYQAVSGLSPKDAVPLVSQAIGLPIKHYFIITQNSLNLVLNALYYHAKGWPAQQTPSAMLQTFGYPDGRIQPRQEVQLLTRITNEVPLLSPLTASSLMGIQKTSATNLSNHLIFVLGNYIRGHSLAPGHLSRQNTHRRSHG